jgi:hypothetical protein
MSRLVQWLCFELLIVRVGIGIASGVCIMAVLCHILGNKRKAEAHRNHLSIVNTGTS